MSSADPGIEPRERPTSEDAGHVDLYTNRHRSILAAWAAPNGDRPQLTDTNNRRTRRADSHSPLTYSWAAQWGLVVVLASDRHTTQQNQHCRPVAVRHGPRYWRGALRRNMVKRGFAD